MIEKLIHTAEGELKVDNPFFVPGTKIRLPAGWASDGRGYGYINEKTILETKRLRMRSVTYKNNIYYAIKPHGISRYHGPQAQMEIVDGG